MRYSESERRRIVVQLGDYKRLDEASKALGVSERTLREWSVELVGSRPSALLGKKAVVAPIRSNSEVLKVLICPDVHVPYHHVRTWECFLNVAKGWKPDHLVFLGDFADFYKVSDYPKNPACQLSFEAECKAVGEELDRVCALNIPRVTFCKGNHEDRLERNIAKNAPWAHGIISTKKLLRIEERGWDWVEYHDYTSIGKLQFTHDLERAGKYAAPQTLDDMGHNIIFGHTHRASQFYKSTFVGERHMGMDCGWMGDPATIAFDYKGRIKAIRENQHGFAMAYVDPSDGCGWAHFVPIINGKTCVEGKLYQG